MTARTPPAGPWRRPGPALAVLALWAAPALGYVMPVTGVLKRLGQRRALQLEPGRGEAAFGEALALERMGEARAAASAFRRFLALQPRGRWAREAEAHLRRLEAGR